MIARDPQSPPGSDKSRDASSERAWLALADGTVFDGVAFGARGTTTGEAVFTTAMTGYQEVLTDPSYYGQIVTMTAPEIGNVGVNGDDTESVTTRPRVAGFVVRSASPIASSWRAQESLDTYLARHGIVGIADLDTRALTRHLRDRGSQNAAIGTEPPEALVRHARAAPDMNGLDLVRRVTPGEPYAGIGARSAPSRRRLRLRHQTQHLAMPRRRRLPPERRPGEYYGRCRARPEAEWHLPVQWSR
jgi:carbamoyl-phosphate synthase small subunit